MQSSLTDHISETVDAPEWPGERCLSLTVRGPWGHFRRVDGNTVKATYRIMPRTTVAGLLAAVAGYDRDSYYGLFGPEVSAIAIEPRGELRTLNLPQNSLTTSYEGLKSVNARGKVSVYYPDPTHDRQRSNYEVLVDPAYRIDVWLDDSNAYRHLRSMLREGRSHYVPSLGLSEHLATVEYHGEHAIERLDGETTWIDSAVPEPTAVIPEEGRTHGTERSPAFMERTTGRGEFSGRRTTEYVTYAYSHSGSQLHVRDAPAARVDGRNVVFV